MHKFSSNHAIRRLRLAALLMAAKWLFAPIAAGLLVYSLIIQDRHLALIGLGLLIVVGITVLFQWYVASRATCPLCLTPVLADKGCAKHRNAKPLLGSHRLRVALAVLCLNRFRCPFCGEPTVLQVREGRRR